MDSIARAIEHAHHLHRGAAPEHLSRRLGALVLDDEVVYAEAVVGRIVVLTPTRVIVAHEDEGSVSARTWSRRGLRQVDMLGTNARWEAGEDGHLPEGCHVRLTFGNGEVLALPLDASTRDRRRDLWALLPDLLNDLSGDREAG